MQHPASPAVARPSCQTLELLWRAKNPSRLSRAVRAAAGEPSLVRQEVRLHRRPGLSVPQAGGQRTIGSGRREERLLLRGHPSSQERSASPARPPSNAGSTGTTKHADPNRATEAGRVSPRSNAEYRQARLWAARQACDQSAEPVSVKRSLVAQRRKEFVVYGKQSPNPSIEGTCNIRLRRLSPAPHVKR